MHFVFYFIALQRVVDFLFLLGPPVANLGHGFASLLFGEVVCHGK
jgi:hypothetical protein